MPPTRAYQPINSDPPSLLDQELDKSLARYMEVSIPIESDANLEKRKASLSAIRQIIRDWVKFVAVEEFRMSPEDAEMVGGEIFISGSYRLRIFEPGSDIDVLCVAPTFVSRDHFFTSLKERLQSNPHISELISIETARVPVLSFDYADISIDLLFASLPISRIPSDLKLNDDSILIGVDDSTKDSLNGPRVTDLIVELVPSMIAFLPVVRCIRKWAKAVGIYSNKLGYLGGVNLNILVAFVCQLYPGLSSSHVNSPAGLLRKFFTLYSNWQWPTPIMICEQTVYTQSLSLTFPVWNAIENPNHVMPILTPAYPSMNSSANVSSQSLLVIVREFKRGLEVMGEIYGQFEATLSSSSSSSSIDMDSIWSQLFRPTDFFSCYRHYLALNVYSIPPPTSSSSSSSHSEYVSQVRKQWIGFAESKIRRFPESLLKLGISSSSSSRSFSLAPKFRRMLRDVHLLPVPFSPGTVPIKDSACYFIGFDHISSPSLTSLEVSRYQLEHPDEDGIKLTRLVMNIDDAVNDFKTNVLSYFDIPYSADSLSESVRMDLAYHENYLAFTVQYFRWKDLPLFVFKLGSGGGVGGVCRRRLSLAVRLSLMPQDDDDDVVSGVKRSRDESVVVEEVGDADVTKTAKMMKDDEDDGNNVSRLNESKMTAIEPGNDLNNRKSLNYPQFKPYEFAVFRPKSLLPHKTNEIIIPRKVVLKML